MKKEELKDKILSEYGMGNIVYTTPEGMGVVPIKGFINQPTEGLLYDLNRLPEVVLTFIDDPKWINDYAVAIVIMKLKEKIAKLQRATTAARKHGKLKNGNRASGRA